MENVESLFDGVEVLEGAITCELNSQNVEASRIAAEIQVDRDSSEKEIAHHYNFVTAKHAEREKRVAAVREEGRGRLEELQRRLADAKHELSVIQSPILILPYEVTAEIFNWYVSMGGNLKIMLLVCKRWTTVTYTSPRLWSRIAVIYRCPCPVRLQGAVICDTITYLRSALSRSQASPLQIEISLGRHSYCVIRDDSSQSSSSHHSASNRDEAISLILDNRILRRCTYIVLRSYPTSIDHVRPPMVLENMTILPLLSSLYMGPSLDNAGIHIARSLIKFSPSLRHIRCCSNTIGPQDFGIGMWPKRIESFGWVDAYKSSRWLHESSSLRELAIYGCPDVAITLPALQVLRWSISTYSALHLITAPQLHTLMLTYQWRFGRWSASRIILPNLRVAIHTKIPDLTILHAFQTPALEHLSIQSEVQEPTALFELFDGATHMPTPKSLHLECAFTDAALIAVLGRLPWLEELQVAGTIAQDAFWEGLTPSNKPTWRVWLPQSHQDDERANRILTPNLKILLVNYSTGNNNLYTPPKSQPTRAQRVTREQRAEISQVSGRLPDGSGGGGGGEWTVRQASAVAVARAQAGCPLGTLACWSLEKKVEVLIGCLDTLPQRPKWVLFFFQHSAMRLKPPNVLLLPDGTMAGGLATLKEAASQHWLHVMPWTVTIIRSW